jgi:hypothetical protein
MKFQDPGPQIDKEWLFSRITEEEIFEFYTGIHPSYKGHFCSPIRPDQHPTCSYRYGSDGRPRFKDWASDDTYDCIDMVEIMHRTGYRGAIEKIAWDFKLSNTPIDLEKQELHHEREKRKWKLGYRKEDTEIRVHTVPFVDTTLDYFSQQGVSLPTLKHYWVYQIDRAWVNGKDIYWGDPDDPAVAYYLGKKDGLELWKIYFFTRRDKRFICNTRRYQGWLQLPETDTDLVITKSMKDVMTLHELGVSAIAPQGETVVVTQHVIDALRARFDRLWSLYDWDLPGVKAAKRLKREFGIPALFVHQYGAKDISDLVKAEGMEFVQNLVEEFCGEIQNYTD